MNAVLIWSVEVTLGASVLALIAAATAKIFPRKPALAHALWLLVLVKFVAPPLFDWPLPRWPEPTEAVVAIAEPVARPVKPSPTQPLEDRTFKVDVDRSADAPLPLEPELEPDAALGDILGEMLGDATEKVARDPIASQPESPLRVAIAPIYEEAISPTPIAPAARSFPWQRGLIAIWIGGAVVAAFLHARRLARQLRAIANSSPAPDWLVDEVERMAAKIGVRSPRVALAPSPSPFVIAFWRPRLVWPARLATIEDAARYRGVIAHELAHLARRDHWVAWLELAVAVAWWWHPLAWLARRNMRESAEQACDAMAIEQVARDAAGDGRKQYADLFLQLSCGLDSSLPTSILPSSIASGHALCVAAGVRRTFKKRLVLMFSERVSSRLSWRGVIAVAGLALLALPTFSLGQAPGEKPAPATPTTPPAATPFDVPLPTLPPSAPNAPSDPGALSAPALGPLPLAIDFSAAPAADPNLSLTQPPVPSTVPLTDPLAPPTFTAPMNSLPAPELPSANPFQLLPTAPAPAAGQPSNKPPLLELPTDAAPDPAWNPGIVERLDRLERAVASLTAILSRDATPVIPYGKPKGPSNANSFSVDEQPTQKPAPVESQPSQPYQLPSTSPISGSPAPSIGIDSLDLVSLSTRYAETDGEVRLAEKTYARLKSLADKGGSVAQAELDAAEIALSTAQRKQRILRMIVEVSLQNAQQEARHSIELFKKGYAPEGAALQAETRVRILQAILE